MTEVKILIEGYTTEDTPEETSCSTVTLVRDKNIIMVVDPGTMKDQKLLVEELKEEGLKKRGCKYSLHYPFSYGSLSEYWDVPESKSIRLLGFMG
jgi:hypothetical protein